MTYSAPIIAMLAAAISGQEAAPEEIRVGISPFVPFVVAKEAPAGYSIELWERVALKLGAKFSYVETPGVQEKLRMLEAKEIDLAIGGITMTREREERLDFTLPTANAGIGILVRTEDSEGSMWSSIITAFGRTRSGVVVAFIFLIVIAGHLIWFAERGEDMFSDNYKQGVLEGMYWAIVTASTVGYGDKAPVKWAGRLLAGLVIIISLPMFALFTAELASAFTVQQLHGRIRGPEDLKESPVGVLKGTTSALYAEEYGLPTYEADKIEPLYDALLTQRIDAVIYDAPNLRHYARTQGQGRVTLAGRPFKKQPVGMAVPEGSALRERINRALLELKEDGEMDRLRARWLGD